METTVDLKKRILAFVEKADESMLRILSRIIDAEKVDDFELSDELKEILQQRLQQHREDPTSGKSWTETKQALKKEYDL